LKKLLNDELKSRSRKNLVKSKSLMEMLENAIKKYHNKVLTAAEVMDELIKLSKEIISMDDEASELGLTEFEHAFYTAVANNKSAKELMQHDIIHITPRITGKIKLQSEVRAAQLYFVRVHAFVSPSMPQQ
jgi:type I restriction enzyme R subunit